jgi:hypothetical protein
MPKLRTKKEKKRIFLKHSNIQNKLVKDNTQSNEER